MIFFLKNRGATFPSAQTSLASLSAASSLGRRAVLEEGFENRLSTKRKTKKNSTARSRHAKGQQGTSGESSSRRETFTSATGSEGATTGALVVTGARDLASGTIQHTSLLSSSKDHTLASILKSVGFFFRRALCALRASSDCSPSG